MLSRRAAIVGPAAVAASTLSARRRASAETAELRIGCTTPLSGPASSYGLGARTLEAFFKSVNDQGGVAGRKVDFMLADDGYSPPRTVEQVRRLVEQEGVSCMLYMLGTPTGLAVVRYLNARKVPQLLQAATADLWGDHKAHPWALGFPPSGRLEAQIYCRYVLSQKPDARISVLHQDDDFGKDFPAGVRDVMGAAYDERVTTASFQVTDPTIDSQLIQLKEIGADAVICGVAAKFAALAIRRVWDMGWHPIMTVNYGSSSVVSVIQPAGVEKAVGLVSSAFTKEPADPDYAADPGMQDYKRFMAKYMPNADADDVYSAQGYLAGVTALQALRQCGEDLSRENIMRQFTNLRDVAPPLLLPGITINTSPSDYRPIKQLQLQRWDGKRWRRFGEVKSAAVP